MNEYMRALRFSSGQGMDMIGDMEITATKLRKLKSRLEILKVGLQDETAREKAHLLETRIINFMEKNDLD